MDNLCYGCGHVLVQDSATKLWRCNYCGLMQSTPIMTGGFLGDGDTSVNNTVTRSILNV